ncbi:MAG TPA: RES family NAD+ phosphorylase [Pseudomonas sp.]|uniref:RES family NAD+ phosphorylase n=1 Tax=Pseudomonas sp. TaxID=306 RepID=UPI002EDA9C88
MEVWRIAKASSVDDLSGQDAALNGGRWNHREHCAVYAGLTPALCALETFVHAAEVPRWPLKIVRLKLPDIAALYWQPTFAQLPPGWNACPADIPSMDFGTTWLNNNEHLGLIVPSAMLNQAQHIMLNPRHKAISQIEVVDMSDLFYDRRMSILTG